MYACRDEIHERSEKLLDDNYFTQTLLPDFMTQNPELTADWDVAFDDRGHFREPHTGREIGLGTLAVRGYIEGTQKLKPRSAALAPARVDTWGPHGAYGAMLYVEKEGFDALFEREQLAERFDIGVMSCKGMSVVAARKLVDEICHAWRIPLYVLRDLDKAGFSICGGFMRRQSRRYTFENQIKVFDLALRLVDAQRLGLRDEAAPKAKQGKDPEKTEMNRRANLQRNGATPEEIDFLRTRRVELNAMTSRQLVDFIERKLTEHGVKKIIPAKADLAEAYRTPAHGHEAEAVIKRELAKLNGARVPVPPDLKERVENYLRQHPATRWDAAVAAIVRRRA